MTLLANVITCLNHLSAAYIKITNKIKVIRVISIKSHVNRLEKFSKAISVVEENIKDMLKMTWYKSCMNHSRNSIEAK